MMMAETDFEARLVENWDRIYRLALRVTGNRHEASDVVQETMASAFASRHRFRGEARISTYLYRIGLNQAWALLRKKKSAAGVLDKPDLVPDRRDNPAQAFQKGEKQAELAGAVDRLPDRQKVAVHLRIYEQLSFDEIGRVLGCRTATARTNYFFGLQNLRKIIGSPKGSRSTGEVNNT